MKQVFLGIIGALMLSAPVSLMAKDEDYLDAVGRANIASDFDIRNLQASVSDPNFATGEVTVTISATLAGGFPGAEAKLKVVRVLDTGFGDQHFVLRAEVIDDGRVVAQSADGQGTHSEVSFKIGVGPGALRSNSFKLHLYALTDRDAVIRVFSRDDLGFPVQPSE